MTEKDIPPIPDLPPEIIRAIENDKLIIFIGAGVSRLMGCKGWDELAKDLIGGCYPKYIDYREKETLELERDHKKIITMCYHLLKNNGEEETFYKVFDEALKKRNSSEASNIYGILANLNAIFITTNADRHFDDSFQKERIYSNEIAFEKNNLEARKLFHIHGSQDLRNSLIFTVDKYIQRYKDAKFQEFLRNIFESGNWTVLFMGYGLSEFELLDYVIGKCSSGDDRGSNEGTYKHFALLPYYNEEVHLKGIHQLYYDRLGIKILAYRKNEKGYEQLYYIIKNWNDQQIRKTQMIPKTFEDIENFVNKL
jgi:hypothetical protein